MQPGKAASCVLAGRGRRLGSCHPLGRTPPASRPDPGNRRWRGASCAFRYLRTRDPGLRLPSHLVLNRLQAGEPGAPQHVTTAHSEGVEVWQDAPSAHADGRPRSLPPGRAPDCASYTARTYKWLEASCSLLCGHHTASLSRRGHGDPSSQP